MALDGVEFGAAGCEHPAEQFRQAVGLGDGRGGKVAPRIKTLDPAAPARGTLHPKQSRPGILFVVFQCRCHAVTPASVLRENGQCN